MSGSRGTIHDHRKRWLGAAPLSTNGSLFGGHGFYRWQSRNPRRYFRGHSILLPSSSLHIPAAPFLRIRAPAALTNFVLTGEQKSGGAKHPVSLRSFQRVLLAVSRFAYGLFGGPFLHAGRFAGNSAAPEA